MIDQIRMLLIEDNHLLREGIVAMLKDRDGIKIKASTGRKDEIDKVFSLFKPHVILLNLGLYSQNSLLLVKEVTEEHPDAKILVMDLSPTKKEIISFMDAGAKGFILKDATPQEFVKTIKAIANGEVVIPKLFTDLLLSHIVELAAGKGEIDLNRTVQITNFELELLKLVNEGLSNRDIAKKLNISSKSVNTHIHNIKQNLSIFSLLELVHLISSKSKLGDNE